VPGAGGRAGLQGVRLPVVVAGPDATPPPGTPSPAATTTTTAGTAGATGGGLVAGVGAGAAR
jgi:hypothetical protein